MPITFSHVQNVGVQAADPASVTLSPAPVNGNLLVACAMERSGGSASNFTITGTGWTQRVALTIEQTQSTWRRSFVVWTKIAGASEPATIDVDDGTANSKLLSVSEFSHGSGSGTWNFEAVVSNHNGATSSATVLSTGTTASVPAGNLLKIGALSVKRSGSTILSTTWTNGLTEQSDIGDGVAGGRQVFVAMSGSDTAAGTKESQATLNASDINGGLAAALLVFSASEPPAGGGAAIHTIRRMLGC